MRRNRLAVVTPLLGMSLAIGIADVSHAGSLNRPATPAVTSSPRSAVDPAPQPRHRSKHKKGSGGTELAGKPYAQGFRSGYSTGYSDGKSSCGTTNRYRHSRHSKRTSSGVAAFREGFSAGYSSGFSAGCAAAKH